MNNRTAKLALRGLVIYALATAAVAMSYGGPHGGVYRAPAGRAPAGRGAAPLGPIPGQSRTLRAKARPSIAPGPVRPSTRRASTTDYTQWSWWWEFNKEPLLDLKRTLFEDGPITGPRRGDEVSARRPTIPQIREVVLPALLRVLETYESNDLTSAAMIAVARLAEGEGGVGSQAVRERLLPLMQHKSQEISETALVALGILGHHSAAFDLAEVLLDTKSGRRLVGRRARVPLRSRAFAAYSMALLSGATPSEDLRRFLVQRLLRAFDELDESTPDIATAIVIALGRIPLDDRPLPTAGATKKDHPVILTRGEQIRWMMSRLGDRKLNRIVRGHVPTSLVYLLRDPGLSASIHQRTIAMSAMVGLIEAKRTPREVLQGCTQALGLLVDASAAPVHARARSVLLGAEKKVNDIGARNFATLSLGRIAASATQAADQMEVQQELRSALLRRAASPGSTKARWAILSLALLERGRSERGQVPNASVADAILDSLARVSSPLDVGLLAISAGLLRESRLEGALLEKFERIGEDQARGYLAVGLGMLGSKEALPRLQKILEDSTYRPDLLSNVAIALGILGDRSAVPDLIERLGEARSLSSQASLAQALGRIGDAKAVDPLVAMLENDRASALARAFAAVALGRMADLDPLPWNTRLSVDIQYHAQTTTLFDEAAFGILNLL